jgi:hypothetical protein
MRTFRIDLFIFLFFVHFHVIAPISTKLGMMVKDPSREILYISKPKLFTLYIPERFLNPQKELITLLLQKILASLSRFSSFDSA